MNKLWLVFRREARRRILRKSFVLLLFSMPMMLTVAIGTGWLIDHMESNDAPLGYVDHAGLLADPQPAPRAGASPDNPAPPRQVPLTPFESEAAAHDALTAGQIQAYYVLPADYEETNHVTLVYVEPPAYHATRQFWDFMQINRLTDLSPTVARRAVAGSNLIVRWPEDGREFSQGTFFNNFVPLLTVVVSIFLLLMTSGYLVEALGEEKNNRTVEILMTSLAPGRLVGGKVLSIVAMALALLAGWALLAALAIWIGGGWLDVAALQNLRFDWGLVAVLGAVALPTLVMMAGLMAALGATVAQAQEAQQMTGLFALPFWIPLWLAPLMLEHPAEGLALGLSLFPPTALSTLGLRLMVAPVPTWQIVAGATTCTLAAVGALWLAGRAFRLGMLRYGQRLSWRELLGVATPSPAPVPKSGPRTRSAEDTPMAPAAPLALAPSLTHAHDARVNKTRLVMNYEIRRTVGRRSFLFTMFGIPLLMALIVLGLSALRGGGGDAPAVSEALSGPAEASELRVEGYVDPGGLIQSLPDDLPAGALVPYPDETRARQALEAGQIRAYYVIPEDYVQHGDLLYVNPDYRFTGSGDWSWGMRWAIFDNLLGNDPARVARARQPMDVQVQALAPTTRRDIDDPWTFYVPFIAVLMLCFLIMLSAGLLLDSVSDEKKNRVMEIMMLSVTPRQMLTGKAIGLGLLGVAQTAVWVSTGWALLHFSGTRLDMPAGFAPSPAIIGWGLLFFVGGYAVYASLMAGLGALAASPTQASQATFLVIWPLVLSLMFIAPMIEAPHGTLATALSLFPLTAPSTMMLRLVSGGVPWWQPPLAVGLLCLTALWVMRAVARLFRAQFLLTGQEITPQRLYRALLRGQD